MMLIEVCEKGAKLTYPNVADSTIKKIGQAIWEASPTGELWHVFTLHEMLEENSAEEIKDFVKSLLGVDRTAQYEELQQDIEKTT